ncbi:hypothetical protein [Mesorhizobium sp. B2-4-14]|uniref:hypothetical protein n=1 Tax=Mesorhizobium sp. B2-4-14 TaxID=2589935 RepID=UPI001FEE1437|nr:hypothetical protein [Mesorhizobium sp. B2-4-14]
MVARLHECANWLIYLHIFKFPLVRGRPWMHAPTKIETDRLWEASMRYNFSMRLRDDVNSAVRTAFHRGIVNITAVAEQVRVRNLVENVALEDIEYLVLQAAQLFGAPIEFDAQSSGLALPGNGFAEDGGEGAIVPPDLHQHVSMQ